MLVWVEVVVTGKKTVVDAGSIIVTIDHINIIVYRCLT